MGVIETQKAQVEIGVVETEPQDRCESAATEQRLLDQAPAVRVAVDSLVITDSPRMFGENLEHIQALVNAQGELPPITVHRTSMRVLDGIHRLRAAQICGRNEIQVRFFEGNDADAFVVAVRSNIAHGLPLSLAERKAAANRIVASHPQWSDRLIASVTGLAAGTVAEMRRNSDEDAPPTDLRIGLDGRARPVNSAERRRIASKLLIDDPNLSLRRVARIAGISPETARDVRSKLRDEERSIPLERRRVRRADHVTRDEKRQDHAGGASLEKLSQIMPQLKSDPTLRFTDTGRTLLRLLALHAAISNDKWFKLSDTVPAHCKGTIANVAMECAEVWRRFSERLAKQDTA